MAFKEMPAPIAARFLYVRRAAHLFFGAGRFPFVTSFPVFPRENGMFFLLFVKDGNKLMLEIPTGTQYNLSMVGKSGGSWSVGPRFLHSGHAEGAYADWEIST
ncbi:hypothetical protein [Ethanoligenens harbinense]|uniref:hypothetical protein n=1 Tax=Ethanoligenens harbinense TaxID=253239 RepID=UPI0013C4E557|nr:hypothetical protein [Ethanoligenens harbinense]